jgi:hypothetical protein
MINLEINSFPSKEDIKLLKGAIKKLLASHKKLIKSCGGKDIFNTGVVSLIEKIKSCEDSYYQKGFPARALTNIVDDISKELKQKNLKIHTIGWHKEDAYSLLEPYEQKPPLKKVAHSFKNS